MRCCEVEDPLNNLKWLNSVYHNSYTYGSQATTLSYSYYYFIYVFKNDSTNEEFVVTKEDLNNSSKPTFALYSCDGKIIDKGYYQDYDSEYANPDIQFVKIDTTTASEGYIILENLDERAYNLGVYISTNVINQQKCGSYGKI